jgi:uncharacterized protein YhbP (UPF0306 family)
LSKENLAHIIAFLKKHHVLSLATSNGQELSNCSLFYTFCEETLSFIVASSDDTLHIRYVKQNNQIAGNIYLETSIVGKIQGVQFRGEMFALEDEILKNKYFKTFPYAIALKPKLWQIKVNYFKMTDNNLGFGKKLIWENS